AQPSQGTCTGGSIITCELGAIADAAFAGVQFVVTPTIGGDLPIALEVTGAQQELNAANNSASYTVSAVVPDFSVSTVSNSLTMSRGGQTTETINFPVQGGFSGAIALTCCVSGRGGRPTCGIAPASVDAGGSTTLTVDARALVAGFVQWYGSETAGGLFATLMPLGLLGCLLTTRYDKR